jgi:DNA repair protein RecN (Recombination protein N)
MLAELSIKDFVLIDNAQIQFRRNLNILTGETGAGKTIIMDALSMVLGERASSDSIRQGKDHATVEAVFELDRQSPCYSRLLPLFEEAGLDIGETLILKRMLNASGKNRCYVNNSTTTLKTLNDIGNRLVDLHGQHDHQTLLNPKTYQTILDAFGGLEEQCGELRKTYQEWREAHNQVQELVDRERERIRMMDQLKFQTQEIERANPRSEEEEELASERRRLRNFEALSENIGATIRTLDGDTEGSAGVLEQVGRIQSWLEAMAERDSELSEARNLAENATFIFEDLAGMVRSYNEKLEAQPGRLEEVEARLDLLKNLKMKYGSTIEEIMSFLSTSKQDLAKLENYEEERAEIERKLQELTTKLGRMATELSKKRRKVAKQLGGEISVELRQLGMESAKFEVEVSVINLTEHPNVLRVAYPQDDESPITPTGWDEIGFKLSTNAGEPLKTLRQVASGGEISRIMLAIKAVLSRVDEVDVMVFDEIDSGIGGKTAHVVGGKIKTLSQNRQILCITHLAPIASKGDHHLLIEKSSKGGTTSISVTPLDEESRTKELTRMMGTEATEGSLKVAEEMLHAY